MQGKRSHTHDDTGDGHDMHAEVDEWDLKDFRRETTRVQNRRKDNVDVVQDNVDVVQGSYFAVVDQESPQVGSDVMCTVRTTDGQISLVKREHLRHRKWYRIAFLQVTNDKKHDCWSSQAFASHRLEFYDIFHKKGLDEDLKFAWNDEAETARNEAGLMTENTYFISAAAGTAVSGASMQGQDVAAVVTVLRDARAPAEEQPRHKRCDVSETEFERRHALVQDEVFWVWLQGQCNAFQLERQSQLLV